jgi:hypothetical protein
VQETSVDMNLGSCVCKPDDSDKTKIEIINQCMNGGVPTSTFSNNQCQCQCQIQR